MTKPRLAAACLLFTLAFLPASHAATAKGDGKLHIAAIDVEGGQSTLFVSPTGQSLLVDAGWPGSNFRDADRIAAAAHDLGIDHIDAVLISHFHTDHVGGVPQLVQRIPVVTFLDHGEMYEKGSDVPQIYAAYQAVLATGKYKHITLRAGEKLPVAGFDGTVISSDGKVIAQPLAGGGQANALCASAPTLPEDTTENGHSAGLVLRFAGLKILDAGDLTADRERSLMCPTNKLGNIDLAIVSHHGSDLSSSRVFVHALHPRVAVMDNGETKGGSTSVIDTWKSAPGLQALFQLHAAPVAGTSNPAGTQQGGPEHNVPEAQIANRVGEDGKRIDVTVNADGSMDVVNQRTGMAQHFARR
ncbi:MAG: ComEC/Rec2 family competence protein [Janthinobacterium lividum]